MFSIKVNNVDMSNYWIGGTNIPFSNRNKDYSVILTELTLIFSWNTPIGSLQEGYEVTFQEYNSAYPFWIGYITRTPVKNDSQTYEVIAQNVLNKLNNTLVTYDSLHPYLIDSDLKKYNPNGYNTGYATVQVVHLLETLSQYLPPSIQIDCSALEGETPFNFIETIGWVGDHNIYTRDLYFAEDMIWCINNNVATKHDNIETNPDYSVNVFTLFELFQQIMSSLGLVYYYSRSGAAKRIMITIGDNAIPSFSNNLIYHKMTDNYEAEENGYSYKIYFNDDYTKYKSNDLNELEEIESTVDDEGKVSIPTIKNLVYTYQKPSGDDGEVLGIADFAQIEGRESLQGKKYIYPFDSVGNGTKSVGMLNKKIFAKTRAHAVTEITTGYLFTVVNALTHSIDVNKSEKKSKIRYEFA